MAEINAYKEWLASGQTQREVVETLTIYHPAWGRTRIVNADRDLRATNETGYTVTYNAGRFYMDPAETNDTTAQSTRVAVSSLDGRLYDSIKELTFDQRVTPITAAHRLFFLDDPLSGPLIDPPPVWTVHSIQATREAISAEFRAEALREQKIGLYYTAHEFPALVYL